MKAKIILVILLVCSRFVAHAQTPGLIWAKQLGGVSQDDGFCVKADLNGNIYTAGAFNGIADFDPCSGVYNLISAGFEDIFICKFDPNGNLLWAKRMGGPEQDFASSIALDAVGNVYITGDFNGTADFDPGPGVYTMTSAGYKDNFIAKLDASGNFVWAKQFAGPADDLSTSIAIDASGNVYTTGSFQSTVDFDPGPGTYNLVAGEADVFVAKLDNNGNLIWAKQMGGISGDYGTSIAIDANGNVYTTGSFTGTADFDPGPGVYNLTATGLPDCWYIFISKLDANGNFIWAKQLGGSGCESGYSIYVDVNNNVYTTGYFQGTGDFDPGPGVYTLTSAGSSEAFATKLDASGNFVWAKDLGGANQDAGNSIVADASGNVYIGGFFTATVDFDPGNGTYNLTSSGSYDAFICKLDAGGNFLAALQFGGAETDFCRNLFVDGNNNIYAIGDFIGTADFNPGTAVYNLNSFAGSEDIFVIKLGLSALTVSASSTTICSGTPVTFTASPNIIGSFYQWQVNGINTGTNSNVFTASALNNNDQVMVIITNNAACPPRIDTSNVIVMTVMSSLTPSVIITSSATSICNGNPVSFTATPTNGGAAPLYEWLLNGITAGTNAPTYTSATLANGDVVTMRMTSSAGCAAVPTVISNAITITVSPALPASLTIMASATTVCAGTSVILTAIPLNGGTAPSYQWKLNGTSSGTNNPVYTNNNFVNGDIISCMMTSNASCATPNIATSNNIAMTINALPAISLGNDSILCAGTVRLLNAGRGYTSYLWSNGNTSATLAVNSIGEYWVHVMSAGGCIGGDTIQINRLVSPPANFLPPDTFICPNSSLVLKPARDFVTYLWSDNSTSSTITVSVPGIYWLKVNDVYGCAGSDTCVITEIECKERFFIPNAFTPNGDGRNDVLRPVILGTPVRYLFTIYNRWGQMIFRTSDPQSGWNGAFNGRHQNTGVFVWKCQYQFQGEPLQLKKGYVTLVN